MLLALPVRKDRKVSLDHKVGRESKAPEGPVVPDHKVPKV